MSSREITAVIVQGEIASDRCWQAVKSLRFVDERLATKLEGAHTIIRDVLDEVVRMDKDARG